MALGNPGLNGPRGRLAQASVPAGRQRPARRRLRAGGDIRSVDRPGARYLAIGRHLNGRPKLKKSNSLIGTALRLLTEDPSNQAALKTSLGTLTRVLDVVNWHAITKDDPKEWLYFCEQFLGETGGAFEQRAAQRFIDQIDHRRQRKARNCDLSSCANWRGSKRHSRAWIMTSSISSVLKRVRAQGILHERTIAHKYGFMEMRARP